jgi:hypothetical protein
VKILLALPDIHPVFNGKCVEKAAKKIGTKSVCAAQKGFK